MPLQSYTLPAYFTLRSGGKTLLTFLFDSGSIWLMMVPLAFCLTHFTQLPILTVYVLCNAVEIIKCVIGWIMIRQGSWIQNLAVT